MRAIRARIIRRIAWSVIYNDDMIPTHKRAAAYRRYYRQLKRAWSRGQ